MPAKEIVVGKVSRQTVDLSGYPDLVVIYLGMRVNVWYGLKRLVGIGPQINSSVAAKPDGLLHHEQLFYSFFPLHVGMRQYWRDLPSLLRWTRSDPHRQWWKDFLRDSGGTGFWHETYTMRGGMEAIYDDVPKRIGFGGFAPLVDAHGTLFSASRRMGQSDIPNPAVEEAELKY